MPSIWEVFDTITSGIWVLFVLGMVILVFTFIIGGYFAPLFKNNYLNNPQVLTWAKDMPDKSWFAFKAVAGISLLGFFAYIVFKMMYEKEPVPEGGY